MKTNKQWVIDAVLRRTDVRVPFNFSCTPPVRRALEKHFDTDNFEAFFDLPIRMTAPVSVKPLYCDPARYGPTITDEYGVVWSTSEIDRGSPIVYCLPEPTLEGCRFPDPTVAYRFEGLDSWCSANRDNFTVIWVGDLWERATFMRGMENLLLDVALNPAFVHKQTPARHR